MAVPVAVIKAAAKVGKAALKTKKASQLSHAEALAEINRLNENIGKRVKRIGQSGVRTQAIEQFLEGRNLGTPETRNEAVSMVSKLRKLDLNPGTRMATAAKTKVREETAARRAELRNRSKDPNQLTKMNQDELIETARILRKDMRDRIRRVRKVAGDTFGVEQAESTIEGMDLEGGTRNSILAAVSDMNRITNFKSLTPTGAKEIRDWNNSVFGDRYNTYSKDQQSALWDAMTEIMELESISSPEAVELIRSILARSPEVAFYDEIKPDGTMRVRAKIGKTLSEAESKASRAEAQNRLIDEYFNESIRKQKERKERTPWTREMGQEYVERAQERRRRRRNR